MDRQIVYPGSIPLDTDFLQVQRQAMVALGVLSRAVLGTDPVLDGLACEPSGGLSVVVGPGSMTALAVVDAAPFGSLGTDLRALCKTGQNLDNTVLTVSVPGVGTQVWLVECALAELDGVPVALPYFNAAAPAVAWSGPGNNGAAQNTQRTVPVVLRMRAGTPATDGTQQPPARVSGWVALYTVTVVAGQGLLRAQDIVVLPDAPFLQYRLPQLTPGFSRQVILTRTTLWPVPAGVRLVRVRLAGGGGGGGGGDETGAVSYGGGGGGAGGYAEGVVRTTPGAAVPVTIGSGGSGSGPLVTGGAGGTTGFGPFGVSAEIRATGGAGGGSNNPDSRGGQGGAGVAGSLLFAGGYGGDGARLIAVPGGNGGASAWGGGGRGAYLGGGPAVGQSPGSGGGGAYGPSCAGGVGAAGIVVIDF